MSKAASVTKANHRAGKRCPARYANTRDSFDLAIEFVDPLLRYTIRLVGNPQDISAEKLSSNVES
jgi:hypothetical protein